MEIFGWNDTDSGVSDFFIEAFPTEYNPASGKLRPTANPVYSVRWTQEEDNFPSFEVRNTGEIFDLNRRFNLGRAAETTF